MLLSKPAIAAPLIWIPVRYASVVSWTAMPLTANGQEADCVVPFAVTLAVMVAVPFSLAVIWPYWSTKATDSSLLLYLLSLENTREKTSF